MKTITQPGLPAFSLTNFSTLSGETNARATFDLHLSGVVLYGAALIKKQSEGQADPGWWVACQSKTWAAGGGQKRYTPTARLDQALSAAVAETAARLYLASQPGV